MRAATGTVVVSVAILVVVWMSRQVRRSVRVHSLKVFGFDLQLMLWLARRMVTIVRKAVVGMKWSGFTVFEFEVFIRRIHMNSIVVDTIVVVSIPIFRLAFGRGGLSRVVLVVRGRHGVVL